MSNLRVQEAKQAIHESVRGGRCVDDPAVLTALNDAVEMLMKEGDWKNTTQVLKICAYNGFAHIPRGVEAILKVDIGGKPADVWHKAWEFVEPGVGDIDHVARGTHDMGLLEAGTYATFWPFLIQGMRVAAFSTEETDVGVTMDVYGMKDPYREQVRAEAGDSGEGEVLSIMRWTDGVQGEIHHPDLTTNLSTNTFASITSVLKPVTAGYITLAGWDPDTNNMQYLAKYHPNELDPTFRWYRIPGANCQCAVEVKMLVKRGFTQLLFDDEIVPIENKLAIEMAVKSIEEKKRGNFQLGLGYQADAVRLLSQEKRNHTREQKVFDVRMEGGYTVNYDINEV